jgi:hypothetical protein
VPTFADKWCYLVSIKDPYGRILGFLDRIMNENNYFIIRKGFVFCDVTPYSPVKVNRRPEKHIASIFRIEEET